MRCVSQPGDGAVQAAAGVGSSGWRYGPAKVPVSLFFMCRSYDII